VASPTTQTQSDPEAALRCWACAGPTQPEVTSGLERLLRCGRCDLMFAPVQGVEQVHAMYDDEYFQGYEGGMIEDGTLPSREREARVRVKLLSRRLATGRVLEIGCAGGHFLAAARDRGYDTVGIEPTDNASAAARRRFGIDVRQGFVEQVDLPAQTLDAACAWHVLEHIPDPVRALQRVAGWLRPGGWLLLEVPNQGSRQSLLKGTAWELFDPRYHVAYYAPPSLRALLERAGFDVAAVYSVAYTVYRPAHSPVAWASAVRQLLRAHAIPWRPHPWRHDLLRAAARVPERGPLLPRQPSGSAASGR
jgi:SAM-dependent methyltransferase